MYPYFRPIDFKIRVTRQAAFASYMWLKEVTTEGGLR
jgi:hypothetical protein